MRYKGKRELPNLRATDLEVVRGWLRTRQSLQAVENAAQYGKAFGLPITERAVRLYCLIWGWSAGRFHGEFGQWQDRVYDKHGPAFVDARIRRVNRLVAQFEGSHRRGYA